MTARSTEEGLKNSGIATTRTALQRIPGNTGTCLSLVGRSGLCDGVQLSGAGVVEDGHCQFLVAFFSSLLGPCADFGEKIIRDQVVEFISENSSHGADQFLLPNVLAIHLKRLQ